MQADGKVLVGGFFFGANSIGGQTRDYIARLDGITGQADSFNPSASDIVRSIVVQPDGKILVGGDFPSIGGQTRRRLARLDSTTGLADSFNPNGTDGGVYSIPLQADGRVLAGGSFSNMGGQTRRGVARLDALTGLADSFDPAGAGSSLIFSITLQADGKILVGGGFSSMGGQLRNNIARLDAITGLADAFNPNPNGGGGVQSIAVQADGKILVGGSFTGIGGQTRNHIARLDSTTGLADPFDPNTNNFVVYAIAVQADGKGCLAGRRNVTTLAPNGGPSVTRNRIARLETDGRLDQTLNLNAVGTTVSAAALQPDGKILLGGNFTSILGSGTQPDCATKFGRHLGCDV